MLKEHPSLLGSHDSFKVLYVDKKFPINTFLFTPQLYFENEAIKEKSNRYWRKYQKFYPEKIENGSSYTSQLLSKEKNHFTIKATNNFFSLGLFTEKVIPYGNWIGIYTGIVKRKTAHMRKNMFLMQFPIGYFSIFSYVIDAKEMGNHTRFINHSFSPNAEIASMILKGSIQVGIRSLQRIKEGEEITINYGNKYWKELDETPI